jgi:hypothetical protein
VVELLLWSEVSSLVSDIVESSAVGSQFVQLGSYSESHNGLEAVDTEVEGSTALEVCTRQRLLKTQQAKKT